MTADAVPTPTVINTIKKTRYGVLLRLFFHSIAQIFNDSDLLKIDHNFTK
jgi:hypothetical protein